MIINTGIRKTRCSSPSYNNQGPFFRGAGRRNFFPTCRPAAQVFVVVLEATAKNGLLLFVCVDEQCGDC